MGVLNGGGGGDGLASDFWQLKQSVCNSIVELKM